MDRYRLLPSFCRFERQDAQKRTPSGVRNGFRQIVVFEQIGYLQGLMLTTPHG